MTVPIGIRREDKNRWERRAPLTPDHVSELAREHGLNVLVERSELRAFPDAAYASAGADVADDLSPCRVVLGVKEIPVAKLLPARTYLYFSHVIKGQRSNMPMLRRLMELGSTLIDYEPIRDRKGRRLIFFGRHAGYAGMFDTLWALGRRLAAEGFPMPLQDVKLAHEYNGLDDAMERLSRIGDRIRHDGLPTGLRPLVVGFTGSGNVSKGAQEVFDRLPFEEIDPDDLRSLPEDRDRPRNVLYKCVLERSHRVARIADGGYDADEYRREPGLYRTALGELLPHLTVLVNGIYWVPGRPRIVSREQLEVLWGADPMPKLRVLGDITCDVGGSIEANVAATEPGDPVYVYDVRTGEARPGVEGRGPVVMAVDNLPCEFPKESSEHFGDSLLRFVPALARCDWDAPLEKLALPPEVAKAVVVHKGALTPAFEYLREALAEG